MDDYSLGRERGQQDVITCIHEAFQTEKEGDPFYNLEGALHDLRRLKADKVCINTIERVQRQIAELYIMIKAYES